jgi:hypothetical protein
MEFAMMRTWFVFGIAVSIAGVISGQEVSPPATSTSPSVNKALVVPAKVADEQNTYVIEMRLLEGIKPLDKGPAIREWIRPGAKAAKSDHPPDRVAPPPVLPAPLPPASSAVKDALRAETSPNDPDEELWRDTPRRSPITVLAAPKLAVLPKQPATVQIGTQQFFSYLVPLGQGKFEAKHTAAQELGMKFTLELQPVEGDDKVVEISPLEVQLSVLDGREPVEGLDLEVGKPIIATRSLKTSATMRLGATRMIELPSGPKTQAVLLLRVKRMDLQERQ